MYYTYILLSEKDGKLYIGFCANLKKRIVRHNAGYVIATKNRRPLKLIYYESFLNGTDARNREIFLKGGLGHQQLKTQLESTFRMVKY
jgi:putative endonuclease